MRTAFIFLVLAFLAGEPVPAGKHDALERYVEAPDPVHAYRQVSTLEGDGYRAHVLEMTSQSWRTPEEVDRTVWKHWVTVVVPRTVRHRTALLYVSGGRTTTPPPEAANPVAPINATAAIAPPISHFDRIVACSLWTRLRCRPGQSPTGA